MCKFYCGQPNFNNEKYVSLFPDNVLWIGLGSGFEFGFG